ncbi:MAG: HAD family phosphatase [Verrucomicrobiaceae bacterium]|nr:HAD family phosphatase [Verrucomicrobiaceae bacterium]
MPRPTILFDIGNVIVHFDFARAAEHFIRYSPLSKADVVRALDPLKAPLESGRLAGDEFVRRGMEMIRFTGTPEEFRHGWCDIFSLNAPMARTIASLDQSVPMRLLSNTNDLHIDFLLEQFPVFTRFGGGVYSHVAGCMKPEETIFRIAIRQLDLDAAQTFYIDDLLPNIETARRLGFRTFHYSDARHAEFEAELSAWHGASSQHEAR